MATAITGRDGAKVSSDAVNAVCSTSTMLVYFSPPRGPSAGQRFKSTLIRQMLHVCKGCTGEHCARQCVAVKVTTVAEVSIGHVTSRQITSRHNGSTKHGILTGHERQIGALQIAASQICTLEITPRQIETCQVHGAQCAVG